MLYIFSDAKKIMFCNSAKHYSKNTLKFSLVSIFYLLISCLILPLALADALFHLYKTRVHLRGYPLCHRLDP